MLGVKSKPDSKFQGSWNENQHESLQIPLVRAVSESEDIRAGSSFGDNMIFVEGELWLLRNQLNFRIGR